MNYKLRLALTCILAVGANNAFGASLLEVYQRAQQSDPTLREADANRLATREARPQAWASLLPQIDGQVGVSRTFANSKGSSPRQIDLGPGGLITTTGETDSRRDPFGWSISLRSTVFSWAKWAALDRSKSQVAQAEVNYQVAQQDLVLRVAQRYFNVLAAK
ncbi:MAG TPA: TolC family protein, partial [Steroidobacteraceae bacterium]|nr:TolC family protein [Steroidobacteraceae bacterium]